MSTQTISPPELSHPESITLTVREIEDAGERPRHVYTFHDTDNQPVTVLFMDSLDPPLQEEKVQNIRDEHDPFVSEREITIVPASAATPLLKEMRTKTCFLLGDKNVKLGNDRWEIFEHTLDDLNDGLGIKKETAGVLAQSHLHSGEAFVIAESSPLRLIQLALILGGGNTKDLQTAHAALKQGRATEFSDYVTDAFAALKLIDQEGELKAGRVQGEAEALIVGALTGDETAQTIVQDRVSTLYRISQRNAEQTRREYREEAKLHMQNSPEGTEAVPLDRLVAVHLTDFLPERRDGRYVMKSTHDATRGKTDRHTVHFSLNHPVVSHVMGNWEHKRCAVVASLKGIIDTNNDMPQSLSSADTFFEVPPGHTLELPADTMIVHAGLVHEGKLYEERSDSQVVYRDHDFTPAMLEQLRAMRDQESFAGLPALRESLAKALGVDLLPWESRIGFEKSKISSEEWHKLEDILGSLDVALDASIGNLLRIKSPAAIAAEVVAKSGINKEHARETIERSLTRIVEAEIATEVRDAVISQVIMQKGPFKEAGEHGWLDGEASIYPVVNELGVTLSSHFYTHFRDIYSGEGMGGKVAQLREGNMTQEEFNQEIHQWISKNFKKFTPSTWRMLVTMGVI